ncbi:MAG: MotA/TolQ/ExbB proton channel family protein [Gemmataceae bacterium]|nr:MotA/TolQ/ExbB proton channel family protein [Gemmataceae bacterium]MCI0738248.1 MotA/TolQ/ExbB proton channel family protein [Gemmataceae bacterium]
MSQGPRGTLSTLAALVFGIAAGATLLWYVANGPLKDTEWARYAQHPVEHAEVILFTCALCVLLTKLGGVVRERAALRRELLPPWDGKAMPAAQAGKLRETLASKPRRIQRSAAGRRVAGVLDFVQKRGAAHELDDQLRTLSDNDALAQESSYSLLRFITWAIPILGFLGTVLGITEAIYGVTPEVLEKSLDRVTGGLATAFDTTALALFLTMILMFFAYVIEKLELNVLAGVDAYIESELAHRFERGGPDSAQFIDALRQNTGVLLAATEKMMSQQTAIWMDSMRKAESTWAQTGAQMRTEFAATLQDALATTLSQHSQRLAQFEEKILARQQELIQGIAKSADSLRQQTELMALLQDGEANLVRMQESLNQNVAALAQIGAFEQAVYSLNAAIHLLTAKLQTPATVPIAVKKAA